MPRADQGRRDGAQVRGGDRVGVGHRAIGWSSGRSAASHPVRWMR